MINNLFLVESPLQALVAVELSLKFEDQTSGIIYNLSRDPARERQDEQIISVIELGVWKYKELYKRPKTKGIFWHIDFKKEISRLKFCFEGNVEKLFFGEFRSQWMHIARLAISPDKYILMDDGAATLIAKSRYIDQGIFYPENLWKKSSYAKRLVRSLIYRGLFNPKQRCRPVSFASAFLKDQSEFTVDFSYIRSKRINLIKSNSGVVLPRKAFFFGSKYSEAGIITCNYELYFISQVIGFYKNKGLDLVYCAHRAESEEKLDLIRALGSVKVLRPDLPAELFLLECDKEVAEIGAAYSSVINSLGLVFPEKPIISFRLNNEDVNPINRKDIEQIYSYYEKSGIFIKEF